MPDVLYEAAERLAGDALTAGRGTDDELDAFARRNHASVPGILRRMYRSGLLVWQADAHTSMVVRPEQLALETPPGEGDRWLRFLDENQGVCAWFVPVDAGDDPPVLVDYFEGEAAIEYAPSLSAYAHASSWDRAHLFDQSCRPLLQAQAEELGAGTLDSLRRAWSETVRTFGWPCGGTSYRFERDGAYVLLWACAGQCDWWVSAESPGRLEEAATGLLSVSNLRSALWSNDVDGEELLSRLR